jgi:2-dehydropantoate 2-reductase
MDRMNVAVFGAGAVGGHMAARLHRSGVPASVIARGAHLAAIRSKGLTLQAQGQTFTYQVLATDDPSSLGPQDVLIVSVKSTGLAAAIAGIKPLIGPRTRVMFAMNGLPWWFFDNKSDDQTARLKAGLDPDGLLRAIVPPERLIWGVVSSGGLIVEPGVIRSSSASNGLTIGYPDGRSDEAIVLLADMLGTAGYKMAISQDIRREIWFKLLLNAGQAMVATLAERDLLQTVSDPETREIVIACIREIMAIGAAIGIDVAADPVEMTNPARAMAHRPSFLQDLMAHRPLELPTTILAARDIGRAYGVSAPHLATVAALVAARSDDTVQRAGKEPGHP